MDESPGGARRAAKRRSSSSSSLSDAIIKSISKEKLCTGTELRCPASLISNQCGNRHKSPLERFLLADHHKLPVHAQARSTGSDDHRPHR